MHLVITSGEPAGIGPEVSYFAAKHFLEKHPDVRMTILGDKSLFRPYQTASPTRLNIEHIPLLDQNTLGQLNLKNAQYVLNLLDRVIIGCQSAEYAAVITAPIQKSIISEVGIPFTGHTEYLAAQTGTGRVVMMLCGKAGLGLNREQYLRVALVTTHLPILEVPKAITYTSVLETIQIVDQDLKQRFGIAKPYIKVTGLNPHAGESGHLGREEMEIIIPAIQFAKTCQINVDGPYPADTIFDLERLKNTDALIAMYHDQGLAPFKMACFGQGVNVTLGLPIIRTSVDHGTALDIAGKQPAEFSSMLAAIDLAYELTRHGTSST